MATTKDSLAKSSQPKEQKKADSKRVDTVTPANDSGKPGKPADKPASDNKNTGPAGGNL